MSISQCALSEKINNSTSLEAITSSFQNVPTTAGNPGSSVGGVDRCPCVDLLRDSRRVTGTSSSSHVYQTIKGPRQQKKTMTQHTHILQEICNHTKHIFLLPLVQYTQPALSKSNMS